MRTKLFLLLTIFNCLAFSFNYSLKANAITTISIKKFGAKGNGKTNDHEAFIQAANYINQKGGNVNLLIPKGTYIIGKQIVRKNNSIYIEGVDAFSIKNCNNVTIRGTKGTIIKYTNNLKFGSFNPENGSVYNHPLPFYDPKYIAQIGCTFKFTNCSGIEMNQLELNGNTPNTIIGGRWGDIGYQLWHYGVHVTNSKKISLKNANIHHYALDGVSLSGNGQEVNDYTLINSKFEYNGRQGLSWIGGNGLLAQNCKFNHTGRSKITSPPSAGVDIEAEGGNEVRNGQFTNCEFNNNKGSGLIANIGPSKDIKFNNCTFYGVTTFSAWVEKPNYTFTQCNFYGAFVHGCVTNNQIDATKFYNCLFEDKKYNGLDVFGKFLIESDGRKMMIFENCIFNSREQKVMWYNGGTLVNEEKAIFKNCTINVFNTNLKNNSFYAVMRKMNIINSTINCYFPKSKNYYLEADHNIDNGLKVNYHIK